MKSKLLFVAAICTFLFAGCVTKKPVEVESVESKQLICDPPSGWLYGFPKRIPIEVSINGKYGEWLVENGYPAELVEIATKHSRFWYENNSN